MYQPAEAFSSSSSAAASTSSSGTQASTPGSPPVGTSPARFCPTGSSPFGAAPPARTGRAAEADPVGGARLLAVVAPVQSVAEGDPEIGVEHPRRLGPARPGTGGRPAPRGRRGRRWGTRPGTGGTGRTRRGPARAGQTRRGASVMTEPSTTMLPAPRTRMLGALAPPADPGPVGRGPVHQAVLVAGDHRPMAVGAQELRHLFQPGPQGPVVVGPVIGRHPGVGPPRRSAGAAPPGESRGRRPPARWRRGGCGPDRRTGPGCGK